jgi:predicted O-methyltransferase YrrM
VRKINTALKALVKIARNPWLLNHVLQDKNEWKQYVFGKYPSFTSLPVVSMDQIAGPEVHASLSPFTFLDGGSLPTDLMLLKLLAKQFDSCRYFEIGTWRGESAVNVASVASECYTLNLSGEEMRAMGVDEKVIDLQGFFSREAKNINHLKGNTKSFNFAGLEKKFDLIFIDGSHHYSMVRNDTEKVFGHLVHPESVIVWHDYAITPEEVRYEVLAGILDGVDEKEHRKLYPVANTKSAMYTRKNWKGDILESPVKPDYYFEVDLKYKKIQ